MSFLNYPSLIKIILKNSSSCSVVNSDGALLFSKDESVDLLTTTRLVSFQIIKKYLNPKPMDIFVLNDPESGGYQYNKLVFVTCLTNNLYLIWDTDYFNIDFKIPPTPIYESGKKNEFVWQALVAPQTYAQNLTDFFELQKQNIDQILFQKKQLEYLANIKNQNQWLKDSQDLFNAQFNNKAEGNFESYFKLQPNQTIKLKLTVEEKQNIKLLTLDFTNTNLAHEISAASHIVESAMIKKIVDFYQLTDFFTQSILDKIKIILPPRSIVSKPQPLGTYNQQLQSICAQLCEYNILQINSHTRKPQSSFELQCGLNFELNSNSIHTQHIITQQMHTFNNLESLISSRLINIKKMCKADSVLQMSFSIEIDNSLVLKIKNDGSLIKTKNSIKINSQVKSIGSFSLNKNDIVDIYWE